MLKRMAAEICCCDPDVGTSVTAVLIERGYDVELLSWVDDDGRAVWLMARILTELAAGDFLDQVTAVVEAETTAAMVVQGGPDWDAEVQDDIVTPPCLIPEGR